MSVLNNFMLVFETDGDKATIKKIEQVDSAGKKLAKTNVETGKSTEVLGKKTLTAAAGFKQFSRALTSAIAPAVALGTVLSQTLNFAMQGEQLLFMAKSANMAADEFQKLAIASQRFGGSREGAAGMMAGLASQIQALRLGQAAPLQDAAMFYGLNLMGRNGALASGNELLRNIAQTMERLDTAAQLDLGRRIGLDEATIRLLQKGVAAFDKELERAQKRSIFKPEDLKRAQELQMATRDLKLSVEGLWSVIARWLLPVVETITVNTTRLFDYLQQHSDAVKAGLTGIAVIMGAIAVSGLIAAGPWLLMAGVIAGLIGLIAILYEDWKVFCNGGSSALGPFWKALKWTIKLVDLLGNSIARAFSAFNPVRLMTGMDFFNPGRSLINSADNNSLAAMPLGGMFSLSNWNRNSTSNIFNLTVNGAKDPVQGGSALLAQAHDDAVGNLTSGQNN